MDTNIHSSPVLSLDREYLYALGVNVDQVDDITFMALAKDIELSLLGVFYSQARLIARRANLPMRFPGKRI